MKDCMYWIWCEVCDEATLWCQNCGQSRCSASKECSECLGSHDLFVKAYQDKTVPRREDIPNTPEQLEAFSRLHPVSNPVF